jgi:hypothetical protein
MERLLTGLDGDEDERFHERCEGAAEMKKFTKRARARLMSVTLATMGMLAANVGIAIAWNPPSIPPL